MWALCGRRAFGRGAWLLTVSVGLIAGANRARADSVPVEIQADRRGDSIQLADWDGPGVPRPCGERCALNLPQGEYRLDLTDAGGRVASRKLVVRRPSHVTVAPPDDSRRELGGNLKATGGGIAVVGSLMIMYSLIHHVAISYSCQGDCDEHAWVMYVGASALVAGGALGIAGKTVEERNSQPHLKVTHPSDAAERGAGPRMSPVAGPRWTGLTLTGSF